MWSAMGGGPGGPDAIGAIVRQGQPPKGKSLLTVLWSLRSSSE